MKQGGMKGSGNLGAKVYHRYLQEKKSRVMAVNLFAKAIQSQNTFICLQIRA